MQGIGDQFFARAAFAGNQDGEVRWRHLPDDIANPLHGGTGAENILETKGGIEPFP
jgi:hypothetical protein